MLLAEAVPWLLGQYLHLGYLSQGCLLIFEALSTTCIVTLGFSSCFQSVLGKGNFQCYVHWCYFCQYYGLHSILRFHVWSWVQYPLLTQPCQGLTQSSIPLWVGKWVPAVIISGGIICIPNRFTVSRGSLMPTMLLREFRREEVTPAYKNEWHQR